MHRISLVVAMVAALGVALIGLHHGTYAAGGSDSSCYALMADAFASGRLQPASELATRVPWPDAPKTFTPGGFVTSEADPSESVPVCAPGFSVLLAPLIIVGGRDAMFILTPVAGAILVWLTFVAARTIGGPLSGAMAAVLVAASPIVLYQIVQPMNDVTTAALWMATFVALLKKRWLLAGVCCGVGLLVRPNLLPLAAIGGLFAVGFSAASAEGYGEPRRSAHDADARRWDWRLGIRNATRVSVAAIPFGLLVLWFNHGLYGSPFRTGYGNLGHLFSLSALSVNASRYPGWLIETHTAFPLLAFAAPFTVSREQRAHVVLAFGLILATCIIYFLYTPFDDWSFLRFLLPAIALMIVLASVVCVYALTHVFSPRLYVSALVVLTVALGTFLVRTAEDRLAFNMKYLEQRYRSAGLVVRDRLPANAVVLSVWDSGAIRFHGRKEALVWAGLDPAWLNRSLAWLDAHGRTPYILVESWEEPQFRSRFSHHSDIGNLDWPPKYEIDRVVRIFDPKDREKYVRGEPVNTEYLWPLRD